MNFTTKIINKMTNEEIYKTFVQKFDYIFNKYKFLNISNEDYKVIVLKEIDDSKTNYDGSILYSIYLEKLVSKALDDEVAKKINDTKYSYNIISNYINQNVKIATTYNKNLNKLKYIVNFLQKYNFELDRNIIIEVIKNNKILSKLLEIIYIENKQKIILGESDEIFNNNIIVLLIKLYCSINNIEIVDKDIELDIFNINNGSDFESFIKQFTNVKVLTKEEEYELFKRYKNGDNEAKELIIKHNIKLVIKIALNYNNEHLSIEDFFQEGIIGLMRAIEDFDYTKGYKFSTFAYCWINQSVDRLIKNNARTVRFPVWMEERIFNYKKTINDLNIKLGKIPSIEEIIVYTDYSINDVIKYEKTLLLPISLNKKIIDDSDAEIIDLIEFHSFGPNEIIKKQELNEMVNTLLKSANLSERELYIVKSRFGFDNKKVETLEEISKKLGISGQRVRQLEVKALKKLQMSPFLLNIIDYSLEPKKAFETIQLLKNYYVNNPHVYSKSIIYDITSKINNEESLSDNKLDEKDIKKRLDLIYIYFNVYTVEQISEVLNYLTNKEKYFLGIECDDLDKKEFNSIDYDDYFYYSLLKKIKSKLNTMYPDVVFPPENINKNNTLKIWYDESRINTVSSDESSEDKELNIKDNKQNKNERDDVNMSKKYKIKSIYELNNDYTKEQVDESIKFLSKDEYNLLVKRYGEDFSNIENETLTDQEYRKFYYSVLAKIRYKLKKLYPKVTVSRKRRSSSKVKTWTDESIIGKQKHQDNDKSSNWKKQIDKKSESDIDNSEIFESSVPIESDNIDVKKDESNEKKELINVNQITDNLIDDSKNMVGTVNEDKEVVKQEEITINKVTLNKEECLKLLDILKSPTFNEMLGTLSHKEAVIISLKLGYVDGKYFSNEAIANFLGIETIEVIETVKKVLLLYKDQFNNFIDNIINFVGSVDNSKKL